MIEKPLTQADALLPMEMDDTVVYEFDIDELMENESPEEEATEEPEHGDNLAEYLDESALQELGSTLVAEFDADKASRREWEKTYVQGIDLLGLKFENRTKPWDGACGVFHPMLTDSIIRFQANTIQEIFPASGPCKTKIVGKATRDLEDQARRVERYMNYTALETMVEYRAETERLLFSLPISGSAFRKVYFDPVLGRPASMFVPAEDFVVNFGTTDLSTAERATHIMKKTANEVLKLQLNGWYRDVDLPDPVPSIDEIQDKIAKVTGDDESYTFDYRHTLLEMHVDVDLPGFEHLDESGEPTGLKLPYVVTVDKSTSTILAIRRNWKEDDVLHRRREYYVHYTYLPGFGFYGFGLIHIIGGLTKSATSILRQLVDAGTLSNLPGGLKSRGLRIKGDDSPIEPGEYRDVDVPSGTIRDNITFLPYKEPSNVLYMLLGDLVEEGRRFASAADVKASDMNAEAPVGTTLAILEREMKVLSAVQARTHASMGRELRILKGVIQDYGPTDYPYTEDEDAVSSEDFDSRVDVIPVSDPNSGTMTQRIMQYQAAMQMSAQDPSVQYNRPLLHRKMLGVLGIADAEDLVPMDEDMKPMDPVSENMAILQGKPTKAFLYQDHEAHIQTHMAAMQNPDILKLLENNPMAPAIQAAAHAHITEHVAYSYRAKVEKELGVPLPGPEEAMPEDIELRLSRIVAAAAAQVTGKAQKMAQAEENAEKSKDPVIQQKERELAIKERQVMENARRDMEKINAEREKVREQEMTKRLSAASKENLDSAKLAVQITDNMSKRVDKQQVEGFKIGMDIARDMVDDNKVNNSNE